MTSAQFVQSVAANIAFWREQQGFIEARAWPALDRDRENLFRATIFGLRLTETWCEAAELALQSFSYVFERGFWPEWIPVLEGAIADCPDDRLALKGRLLNQLGSLYRKERRLDEAQVAHERAEEIGLLLDDHLALGLARCRLGEVYWRQRRYATAEHYALMALAELEAANAPPEGLADAYNLLGLIALRRGELVDSEQKLRQACAFFRLANKPVKVGRTLLNLCNTLEYQGQINETLLLLAEADEIFRTHDLQLERVRQFHILGTLHFRQGNLAEAEAAFRQANTPIMRRSGPVYYQSLTEMNLGNVLLSQGRYEESRAYFLSCVAGFRQVNAQTLLANSLDGLAEISATLGRREEAIRLYEEALDIVAAIPEDAFASRMEKRFVQMLRELRSSLDEEE